MTKKIMIVGIMGRDASASIEKTYNRMINAVSNDGENRVLVSNRHNAMFEDGTTVSKYCITKASTFIGIQITHLYLEDKLLMLQNFEHAVENTFNSMIIEKGDYLNLSAKTDKKERIFIFDQESNIRKYYKN